MTDHYDDEHDVEDEPLAWCPPHGATTARASTLPSVELHRHHEDEGKHLLPTHSQADARWGQPQPITGPITWSTYR